MQPIKTHILCWADFGKANIPMGGVLPLTGFTAAVNCWETIGDAQMPAQARREIVDETVSVKDFGELP